MSFWQAILLALVPSLAAVASAYLGFRDLGLRRRLETSRQFVTLFASAHGRPLDRGDKPIGVGEQLATINLIADFAAREKTLVNAAVAGLRNLETWDQDPSAVAPVDLSNLRGKVSEESIAALRQALDSANESRAFEQRREVAAAARAALKRVEPMMKSDHKVSLPREDSPHFPNSQ